MPYTQTYTNLWLCCLTPEFHERTCNYWYTVTEHATSHTAFTTKEELTQWLNERGLKLTNTLPEERGTYKSMRVEGTYKEVSYMDVEAFKAIVPLLKVAEMSNGQYTLGKVTEDETGTRTVHHLNPNVKERIEFPYWTIKNREEGYLQLINESPDTQE
jgi:hypothetical protein